MVALACDSSEEQAQPIPFSPEEKENIVRYIRLFNSFMNERYEDDPFDPMKRAEYMIFCSSTRSMLKSMYEKIPQIVKDEKLVPRPEHPYY